MRKKMTVSIGIPAYNEDQNIGNILQVLLRQKQAGFIIKEIIVMSDCSSDKTDEIVRLLSSKHPIIKLIREQKRKGKYFLVNQLFKTCRSDILVVLDADIAPVGNDFLKKMVHVLLTDYHAQMVSSHNVLIRPNGFVGKIIYTNFILWDFVRLSMPDYDSAANFHGSATAYRGPFVRSVHIPYALSDPHLFIYLKAAEVNGFRYCREAETLSWSISTITDLKKFLDRSIGKKDEKLEKMFGVEMEKVYYFPKKVKLIGMIKAFLQEPFYTPLAILLGFSIAKFYHSGKVNKSPIWDITVSSKKPIKYAK